MIGNSLLTLEEGGSMPNITNEKPIRGSAEPCIKDIQKIQAEDAGHTFYTAREEARERAYGGKPPTGYQSWGDYWKNY